VAGARASARVAEETEKYAGMSPQMLSKKLKTLERKMYQHAKNLELEESARVRDQIRHIQESNLGLVENVG
jgi:excinuclease ABC subunit B